MAEVVKDEICTACKGTGLQDNQTLCPVCGGTPSKAAREAIAKGEAPVDEQQDAEVEARHANDPTPVESESVETPPTEDASSTDESE